MAWLEGDARNISSGWSPEPKLEAPNIGATLAAILTNRRVQQQQTQEALTAAIKAQQDRNSSAAYIQAAQNAGVLPQGDYSGMTAHAASDLAQRIQDQTPDTDSDNLKAAMAKYYNRLSDTGGTRGGPAGQRPFTQGQQFNALKTQDSTLGKQADELTSQQEDYGLPADVQPATHGYVMRDGKLDYARTPEEQANPMLVSPGDPITDPNAKTFTPDVYKQRQSQSDALKQILAEQDRVRKKILAPQGINQADVDQATQAQGLQAGPSAPPAATGAGSSGGTTDPIQLRQQAQDAISRGADPQAVAQKFKDLTGGQLQEMGAFDDLIPAATPSGGAFDDLIPSPTPSGTPEGGGRDLLFYKSGQTQPQREALNAPLREAMQVPAVSPEAIDQVLQALNTTDEQGPAQQGIDEKVSQALSSMTTGEGVASAPLYMFPPTAAGVTAENVEQIPSQIGQAAQQFSEGDVQQGAGTTTEALLNALSAAGVAHGGVPFVPETVPPPPIGTPLVGKPLVGPPGTTASDFAAQAQPPPVQLPVSQEGAPPTGIDTGRNANLPDWAREQMQQQGIPTNRTFNDFDIANPSVREAIQNDPTLKPEQKASLLKTGAMPPLITPGDEPYAGVTQQPGATQPVGGNVAGFEQVYGPGEVPAGPTLTPEDAWDAAQARAQSGKAQPYNFVARAKTGAITPEEMGDLIYEHHRLVERAASMEGTPNYEGAYQAANDFASNVLKPAENAWHQKGMTMQIARPIDLSNATGMDQLMRQELGRGLRPSEAPKFKQMAQDIGNGQSEVQKAVARSDARVQRSYAKVADISMDEAAARVKQMLKDCM